MSSSSGSVKSINYDSGTEAPDDVEGSTVTVDKQLKLNKVIVVKGSGMEKPGTIDEVTLKYWEPETEEEAPEKLTLFLGQGRLWKGIELIVTSMRQGEVCEAKLGPDLADGSGRLIRVELINFTHRYDILANQALIKTRIVKGFGYEHADMKDDVQVSVSFRCGDLLIYENPGLKSIAEPHIMSEGLFQLVKSLKLHEEASVEIQSQYFLENFQPYYSQGLQLPGPVVAHITLQEMSKVEDLYLDGTFYKRILVNGEGKNIPNTNAHLQVFFKLEANGRVLIENFGYSPLHLILDEDQVPSLWTHCFRQMKEGDRFLVEGNLLGLHSQNASDGLDDQYNLETYPDIGTSMNLTVELVSFEMVLVIQGKTNYNMTTIERANESLRIKEAGIKLFKVGVTQRSYFSRALEKFEAADSTLQPLRDDPYRFNPIHYTMQHNVCVCHMKMKQWHEVETFANKVLDINPEDVKALFRRGMSRKELWNYDAALTDFSAAKGILENKGETSDPNYKEICGELQKTRKLVKEADVKEKELYKNVFKVL